MATNTGLEQIIRPILDAWKAIRVRTAELTRQPIASARNDTQCELLQSIPGVGAITSSTFVAAVEDPDNLRDRGRPGKRFSDRIPKVMRREHDFVGSENAILANLETRLISRTAADPWPKSPPHLSGHP